MKKILRILVFVFFIFLLQGCRQDGDWKPKRELHLRDIKIRDKDQPDKDTDGMLVSIPFNYDSYYIGGVINTNKNQSMSGETIRYRLNGAGWLENDFFLTTQGDYKELKVETGNYIKIPLKRNNWNRGKGIERLNFDLHIIDQFGNETEVKNYYNVEVVTY